MAIRANTVYRAATVTGGSLMESVVKGTKGFQVYLECEDGQTDFIIWLTEKNRERALVYFEALGIKPEQLRNPTYVEHQLPLDIQGREIAFGTKTEYYNGEEQTKVSWIGERRTAAGGLASAVAGFFGASDEAVAAAGSKPFEMEEDDIPF